jgi:hypothetical protein
MHSEHDHPGASHPDYIEFHPVWLAAVLGAIASSKWYPGDISTDRMAWFLGRLEWDPKTSHSIDVMVGRWSLFVRLCVGPRELRLTIRWRGDLHQCVRSMSGKTDHDSFLINPSVGELRREVQWLDPQYLQLVEIE